MLEMIINNVIEIVVSVVVAVITGIGVPMLFQWLQTKMHNESLKVVSADIEALIIRNIEYVEQTMVNQYKQEGKWNPVTQKEVITEAVNGALKDVTNKTVKFLEKNKIDVKDYLFRCIEAKINEIH